MTLLQVETVVLSWLSLKLTLAFARGASPESGPLMSLESARIVTTAFRCGPVFCQVIADTYISTPVGDGGGGLLTVTVIGALVLELPAASVAVAVRECSPS